MQVQGFVFDLPVFVLFGKDMPFISGPEGNCVLAYTEELLAERVQQRDVHIRRIATIDELLKSVLLNEIEGHRRMCFDPIWREGRWTFSKFVVTLRALREALFQELQRIAK